MNVARALALMITFSALTACAANNVASTPTIAVYSAAASPTRWERSPAAIVFRADVTGGNQDEFFTRSETPYCTVYGDNRIVWTNELGPYHVQVLYDQVPDDRIKLFVDSLTLSERIYDYPSQAKYAVPRSNKPSVEFMDLNVDGKPFMTDAFSGWEYAYYQRILDRCRTISTAPVLFEATEGWLSVRPTEYKSQMPMILWDAKASGLSLAGISTGRQPYWLTGSNAPVLWHILTTTPAGVQLVEDDKAYQIALQVPNVTRDSPPAPGAAATAQS